jgi:hypothetical protein
MNDINFQKIDNLGFEEIINSLHLNLEIKIKNKENAV